MSLGYHCSQLLSLVMLLYLAQHEGCHMGCLCGGLGAQSPMQYTQICGRLGTQVILHFTVNLL